VQALAWLLDRRGSLTPRELEFVHGTLADTLREVLRTCGARILERAFEGRFPAPRRKALSRAARAQITFGGSLSVAGFSRRSRYALYSLIRLALITSS